MFDRVAICCGALVCSFFPSLAQAQVSLDGASTWQFEDVQAWGAVYSRLENVIYASIHSDVGYPTGNSLAVFDIDSRTAIDYITIGSEPGLLSISDDGSMIHVAIDGAFSVRSYNTITGDIGQLHPLLVGNNAAVAEDIVVSMGNPGTIFAALDILISTSDGNLRLYGSGGEIPSPGYFTCNSLASVDPNTLVTYNNSDTGYGLYRFSFDGTDIVFEEGRGSLISGFNVRIEAKGGLIYSTNGVVVDPVTLTRLGVFPGGYGAVESIPELGITYYLSGDTLRVFDNETFLLMDEIDFDIPLSSSRELFVAGENRLGYYTTTGVLGIIEGIPVPAPCIVDFTGDGVVDFFDISSFITAINLQSSVADFNTDGNLDFTDLEEFMAAFAEGCH